MTQNPSQSLVPGPSHCLFLESECIALPECSRCDASQFPCVTGALIRLRLFLPPDFGFFVHSFQLYSGVLLSVISIPLLKPPSFALFRLHCTKNCKCFYVFLSHLQFSFTKSSLIELSFFDLKVSQVSFSVKEKNPDCS